MPYISRFFSSLHTVVQMLALSLSDSHLGKTPSKLFDRLFAKLPAGDREILDEYSSESMKQLNRQDEIIYARGLQDGIILCTWIERIARGEVKNIV